MQRKSEILPGNSQPILWNILEIATCEACMCVSETEPQARSTPLIEDSDLQREADEEWTLWNRTINIMNCVDVPGWSTPVEPRTTGQ